MLHAGLALGVGPLTAPVKACEYFAPTLRILHPWTRSSAPGATDAVVNMTFDQVTERDRLLAVETPVARSAVLVVAGRESPVDFAIEPGRESVLGEDATPLRLLGLVHPLLVGRSYPLQLTFEKSGVIAATLNVDFARFR
jgi:copper(I)-binding protein